MRTSEPIHPDSAPRSFPRLGARLALVLVSVVTLNAVFGFVLDRARVRTGARESGVINTARRLAPEVLVLGTSRAKHHYDDALLSRLWERRVYNAGYQAQGFPFSRVVFEQVARETTPKVVIVDVFSLHADLDNVHDLDPWYFDSPVLRSMPSADAKSGIGEVLLMRLPTYRFAGHAWRTLTGAFTSGPDSGVSLLDASRAPEAMTPGATLSGPNAWFIPQLRSLVAEIRATGAKVVLVYSPCHTREYDAAVPMPVRAFAAAEGVPYLDFNDANHPGFGDASFYRDRSHMNERGAHAFSHALAAELPALLPESFPAKPSSVRE